MEAKLDRIHRLRVETCCMLGSRIPNVDDYYRQYVGIIAKGRQLIYINAYGVNSSRSIESSPVTDVCDGGREYWGAFYDVEAKRFFDLTMNGEA